MHYRFTAVILTILTILAAVFGESPAAVSAQTAPDSGDSIDLSAYRVPLIADPNTIDHTVPLPQAFLEREGRTATADIQINYLSAGSDMWGETCQTYPAEARTALEFAASVWESLLVSVVPIKIDTCWAPLPAGVLGASGPTSARRNFTGAPQANVYYVNALANALYGSDLDPAIADIEIMYSSNFASQFYYGTGDTTPGDKYSFVSIALHEIAHGLGFIGGYWMDGGATQISFSPYPYAYDVFTEDNSGTALRSLSNPTLTSTLQSGQVYFDGANANLANGGTRVKLYAPGTWSEGSSYAHLDESFNYTNNSLMTYAIGKGETQLSPGPVTMGLFKDIGWRSAPNPPTSLTASSVSSTQINLSWTDNSADETGFEVYRSLDNCNWSKIVTTSASASSLSDTLLTPNTTYYYKLRAINSVGGSEYTNVANAITPGIPAAPTNLSATTISTTQINLAWTDASSNETSFEIYKSTDGTNFSKITTTAANTTTYNVTSLTSGVLYYFKVKAVNTYGGSESNIASAKTLGVPLPPLNLTAAAISTTQIKLTWTDNSTDEDSFKVYRSPDCSSWVLMTTLPANTTTYTDTGLTLNTTYCYKVKGYNSYGLGNPSNFAQATTWAEIHAVFLPTVRR